jgi:hypothetical protein
MLVYDISNDHPAWLPDEIQKFDGLLPSELFVSRHHKHRFTWSERIYCPKTGDFLPICVLMDNVEISVVLRCLLFEAPVVYVIRPDDPICYVFHASRDVHWKQVRPLESEIVNFPKRSDQLPPWNGSYFDTMWRSLSSQILIEVDPEISSGWMNNGTIFGNRTFLAIA